MVDLPTDLGKLIIREWLADNVRSISDLDIAFCHHAQRLQYLSWVEGAVVGRMKTAHDYPEPKFFELRTLYYEWLLLRRMFPCRVAWGGRDLEVLNPNKQLVSKISHVTINGIFRPDELGQTFISNLVSLTSLRTLLCSLYIPWVWLPHPEKLRSLTITGGIGVPSFVSSPHDARLNNLTELHLLSLDDINASILIHFCAGFPHLRVLGLHFHRASDTWSVLHRNTWSTLPLLSQITTLYLPAVHHEVEVSYSLALCLLDRCPNLTVLRLPIMERTETLRSILAAVVPKLTMLQYADPRPSYYRSEGTKIVVEARDGRPIGQYLSTDLSMQSTGPTEQTSAGGCFAFLSYLCNAINGGASAVKTCRFVKWVRSKAWDALLCKLDYLTHLEFVNSDVSFPAAVWAQLLRLPNLEYLRFSDCRELMVLLADGLTKCKAEGVISNTLKVLSIHDISSFTYIRPGEHECAKYRRTCLALLPFVFPFIHTLILQLYECPSSSLLSLLLNLPQLRQITLEEKTYGKLPSLLETMTAEQWQMIAKQSKCHRWTVCVPLKSLSHVQRLIDGLQPLLNEMTMYITEHPSEESMKVYAEYCQQHGEFQWHREHGHGFRVVFDEFLPPLDPM